MSIGTVGPVVQDYSPRPINYRDEMRVTIQHQIKNNFAKLSDGISNDDKSLANGKNKARLNVLSKIRT